MKKLFIYFISFALLSFSYFKVFGQKFNQISLENGLSQSTVNCIGQDQQGFLWFGTQDGLNRYDGRSIKVYRNNPEDTNSLSDNFVQSILVDSHNNLWIGTWGGGLNIFNQVTQKFKSFKYDANNDKSISGNIIMALYEDSDENIWIGTSGNGINIYQTKFKRFTKLESSLIIGLNNQSNRCKAIIEDSDKNIWIGTSENGVLIHNLKSKFTKELHLNYDALKNITDNSAQTLHFDSNHNLWIGTASAGLIRFSIKENKIKVYTPNEFGIKKSEKFEITSIIADNQKNIWIGTFGNGLFQLNPKTESITNYTHQANDRYSLANNVVLSLFIDKQQLLWVGTLGGGLSYFSPTNNTFNYIKKDFDAQNSLTEDVVMSIYLDKDSNLWIGTYGGGINIYNLKTNEIKELKNSAFSSIQLPGNIVRCIFEDSKSRIWIGTYEGGVGIYDKSSKNFKVFTKTNDENKSLPSNDVWTVFEDNKGNIWLGTWNGLCVYDDKTRTFKNYNNLFAANKVESNRILSMTQADNDCMWIGTNGGGLIKLNTKTNTLKIIKISNNSNSINTGGRIRSLLKEGNKGLWIGTDGNGLIYYNISSDSSNAYTEQNGLPNNVIYSIIPDEENNLWLSTNKGLCRFNTKTKATWNIDVQDGLFSNEFNQGAAFKGYNHELYFGGIKGIVHFNSSSAKPNAFIPNVAITSIKLFGKEISSDSAFCAKKLLQFKYSENFIGFEFAALNFIASEKNQFACKMHGFDKDWILLGTQRQISYTNLDPGIYQFQVKASNNHDVWNNIGTTITIIIHPPFWKTKTFYVLVVIALISLIFLFVQLRLRNLKKSKILLEIEVQDRTMLILDQNKEIFEKNEELQQQKEEIMMQKEHVELLNADLEQQRYEIEMKNKKITDSIRYSLKIQQAILPDKSYISSIFPEHFIIHYPKDIVSGDFYWIASSNDILNNANFVSSNENQILFATIDCTGHGVPGAFMSLMAYNFLNQAFKEHGLIKPSEMLNFMNNKVIETINRPNEEFAVRDGMDILLCSYDKQKQVLEFSAAGMSFIHIRSGELFVYKGDMRPIGYPLTEEFSTYSNQAITILPGDIIYTYTDGFVDQFNEKLDRKYSTKRFKQLLTTIQNVPLASQKAKIIEEFYDWKGKSEQIDDVLIFTIKF